MPEEHDSDCLERLSSRLTNPEFRDGYQRGYEGALGDLLEFVRSFGYPVITEAFVERANYLRAGVIEDLSGMAPPTDLIEQGPPDL